MAANAQTKREVQADNDYYRITKWTLPALGTTGRHPHQFRATILPWTIAQPLLRRDGREQHVDFVAGQAHEIEPGSDDELVNTTEHEVSFLAIEFK